MREKRQARRGPVAGKAALTEARRAAQAEIERLASLLKPDAKWDSIFRRIERLAQSGARAVESPADRAAAERLGFSASDLLAAVRLGDAGRIKRILAGAEARLDAAMEGIPGVVRSADRVAWMKAHAGRQPLPGEVFRWMLVEQERGDIERDEAAMVAHAKDEARRDRDGLLPRPEASELLASLKRLERMRIDDPAAWPTVNGLKDMLGMSRGRIVAAATKGRWGSRNLHRGGPSNPKRGIKVRRRRLKDGKMKWVWVDALKHVGGRPQVRVAPRGIVLVLLALKEIRPEVSPEISSVVRRLKK